MVSLYSGAYDDIDENSYYMTDEMLGMGDTVEEELEFMGYDAIEENGGYFPPELMGKSNFRKWLDKKRKRLKSWKKRRVTRLKKKWKSLPKWKKVLLAPIIGPAIVGAGLAMAPRLMKHARRAGMVRIAKKIRARKAQARQMSQAQLMPRIAPRPKEYQYDNQIEQVSPIQSIQQVTPAPAPATMLPRVVEPAATPVAVAEKPAIDMKKMLPIGLAVVGGLYFMSKKKGK